MKKGRVVIGIGIIVVLLIVVGPLQWYLEEKKEEHVEKLVQTAQNAEIGGGITLRQGIQAYFGASADWNSI